MNELPLFRDVFPSPEVSRSVRRVARARWKRRTSRRLAKAAAMAWGVTLALGAGSMLAEALGVVGVAAGAPAIPMLAAAALTAALIGVAWEGVPFFWRVLQDERAPFFEHLGEALEGWNDNLRWVNRAIVARNEGLLHRDLTPELATLREREAHLGALLRYAEHVAGEGPMGCFTGRRPAGMLVEQREALEALVTGSEEVFQRMIAYEQVDEDRRWASGAPRALRALPEVSAGSG